MKLEISIEELLDLVMRQLRHFFLLRKGAEEECLADAFDNAISRTEFCFSRVKLKYFRQNNDIYFNPFHSGQYCIFLYYLSNSLIKKFPEHQTLADRVYYLNKALNGIDILHSVEMPNVFMIDHPVGSVMGRATYGEYFGFCQGCSIGNNRSIYPVIGQNVTMMSDSKILGSCKIGDNVILGANACVIDTDIPACSLVFGASPNLTIKHRDEEFFRRIDKS